MSSTSFPAPNPEGESWQAPANVPDDALADVEHGEQAHQKKYFSLEEAAACLNQVRDALVQAHGELEALKDNVILLKRILLSQKRAGKKPDEDSLEALRERYAQMETLHMKWISHFESQGIILRDLNQGLIDFPYYAKSLDEEFLLCWKLGEDGLFYFHPAETGFSGRQPISLLPE